VKTLLERAKGSPLDVKSSCLDRASILLLLPHARQFRSLDFVYDCWSNIYRFSEAASGPLPLLHTLKIHMTEMLDPGTTRAPSLPLFSGAVDLKNPVLRSEETPFLNHFTFPNLTTFELSVMPVDEDFPISQLLDFLEASSTLRTVRIKVEAEILLRFVPPEKVIVLPNIEMISVTGYEPGYRIAAHISCPSARHVLLVRGQDAEAEMPQELLPTSATWSTIHPQYIAS
jgi:hypothetical protein